MLKLHQGQVWKHGEAFLRIVRLERLRVEYKTFRDPRAGDGKHRQATKKEFCRLLKNATLVTPAKTSDTLPPPTSRG